MASGMKALSATDACDEDLVELLRACAGSACWARRRMSSRLLGGLLLRRHGAVSTGLGLKCRFNKRKRSGECGDA